jgi:hypothetical protein
MTEVLRLLTSGPNHYNNVVPETYLKYYGFKMHANGRLKITIDTNKLRTYSGAETACHSGALEFTSSF